MESTILSSMLLKTLVRPKITSLSASPRGPVSVALPAELEKRIAREAAHRELKLSTTLRVLASERLQEIEDAEQLSRAEEFQRAQAWASWEGLQAGTVSEVSLAEIDEVFTARRRPRARARTRTRTRAAR